MPERFDRKLWCAELDGEVVGMALTGALIDWLGPWVDQLDQIHVHPDHWRKGRRQRASQDMRRRMARRGRHA